MSFPTPLLLAFFISLVHITSGLAAMKVPGYRNDTKNQLTIQLLIYEWQETLLNSAGVF